MSLLCLAKISPLTELLAGCSVALRNPVHHRRLNHQNRTCLWLWGALQICHMSHWSYPRLNIWPGKVVFHWLLTLAKRVGKLHGFLCWVRYSEDCRSCTFSFLPDFVPRPRTPPCTIHALKTLQFHHFLSLWMITETRCFSAHQSTQEIPQ